MERLAKAIGLGAVAAILPLSLTITDAAWSEGSQAALPGPIQARVLDVVDGDTLKVRARIWLNQDVETNVRIVGVDTPELRGKCEEEKRRARAARDYLAATIGDTPVLLKQVQADKFGNRVLARVELSNGADLAQRLIAEGHARPYRGDARQPWCVG